MSATSSGREILAALVDDGSFVGLRGRPLPPVGQRSAADAYPRTVAIARRSSGSDDSLIVGTAAVRGHDTVVAISEFGFLAGTLSLAAGEAFTAAVREAVARRRPLIAVANSGGARMQEGSGAFVQMIKCVAAIDDLRAAGLPLLVYLAHPTTGGVLASWGSLGHVTFAEPGATIAFTGPRVLAEIEGAGASAGRLRAEHRLEDGQLDAVVGLEQLADAVADILAALAPPTTPGRRGRGASNRDPAWLLPTCEPPAGWRAVSASRSVNRPRPLDLLAACTTHPTRLRGDRLGSDDPSMYVSLCRLGDQPIMAIAHAALPEQPARPTAAGLRLAVRAMEIAESLGVGVLSLIDTPGASPDPESERQGVAGQIAKTLQRMLNLNVPTVAMVVGEGGGGAAIALVAADVVFASTCSWLGPIAPEAGSVILHRSPDHAAEVADMQRVGPGQLHEIGVVDHVVDLRSPTSLGNVGEALEATFSALQSESAAARRRARGGRFDALGLARH
ncbi:MAG TPA: carboxyl transferase domain-containing protein [Ilumatobacter sp.]|nr:carboxyl transferase domain-containing protein [Ilumatobacter sp.]